MADDYVIRILQSWELGCLIPKFKDEEIDEAGFQWLDNSMITSMISKFGLQAKFISKYKKYRSEREAQQVASVSLEQPSLDSTLPFDSIFSPPPLNPVVVNHNTSNTQNVSGSQLVDLTNNAEFRHSDREQLMTFSWKAHRDTLVNGVPELLTSEKFADVTIICEGRSLRCHKMILSSCSPYLDQILSSSLNKHPVILLADLKFWEIQALLDFMYKGQVHVEYDKVSRLLEVSDKLKIRGLWNSDIQIEELQIVESEIEYEKMSEDSAKHSCETSQSDRKRRKTTHSSDKPRTMDEADISVIHKCGKNNTAKDLKGEDSIVEDQGHDVGSQNSSTWEELIDVSHPEKPDGTVSSQTSDTSRFEEHTLKVLDVRSVEEFSPVGKADEWIFDPSTENGENSKSLPGTDSKFETGKKRKNFCAFCKKFISNLARHFILCHKNEKEIQDYMMITDENQQVKKDKRRSIMGKLKNRGNYLYNLEQLNQGRVNELVPVKRLKGTATTNLLYVTCKYCFGAYRKPTIFIHLKKCRQRNDKTGCSEGNYNQASLALIPELPESFKHLNEVFSNMNKDEASVTAQSDPLILLYGLRIFKEDTRVSYVALRMRRLGRVLLAMKEKNPNVQNLQDCLDPDLLRQLQEAVGSICYVKSVTSKLFCSLKMCAKIARLKLLEDPTSITSIGKDILKKLSNFLELIRSDWKIQINIRKVPDIEDVAAVCTSIATNYKITTTNLLSMPTTDHYEALARDIIVHIVLLNRRTWEVVRATIADYATVIPFPVPQDNSFSLEEKESFQHFYIFYMGSKNGDKVPCLLTKEMKLALDCLIASRENVGIKDNHLLFARCRSDKSYVFHRAINQIKKKQLLRNPKSFVVGFLKRHEAALSLLVGFKKNFTEKVCSFIQRFTNMRNKTETFPPASLISSVEQELCNSAATKGIVPENIKSHDETKKNHDSDGINNQEINKVNESQEIENKEQDKKYKYLEGNINNVNETQELENDKHNEKCKQFMDEPAQSSDSEDSIKSELPVKKCKRTRWTDEEKSIVYRVFGKHFMSCKAPHRQEIKKMFEQEPGLSNRTLSQVCTYVNNIVNNKTVIPANILDRIKRDLESQSSS